MATGWVACVPCVIIKALAGGVGTQMWVFPSNLE